MYNACGRYPCGMTISGVCYQPNCVHNPAPYVEAAVNIIDALTIWIAFQNMNSLSEADQKIRTEAWHTIYQHGEQAILRAANQTGEK